MLEKERFLAIIHFLRRENRSMFIDDEEKFEYTTHTRVYTSDGMFYYQKNTTLVSKRELAIKLNFNLEDLGNLDEY